MLFYLITVSSSLIILFAQTEYQKEQLQWSDEQLTIQNLINMGIHDFLTGDFTPTSNVQTVHFNYKTGKVQVAYSISDNDLIELRLQIETNNAFNYEHFTIIMYNT
ncbi:hypothetical protein J2R98_000816 [Alkalibacillus filiformis]|uniref:ComG operon protein 7 n=1 Tax=Alkalibacillus filiformis TaxID=200990 RepID=A0ABU0DRR9_9BACI|nr:hypothetical protein [Alkalibacillus filiformis]MDQ0351013.1 hypothetical protein [Alkalibacillus filiformis]